MKKVILGFFFVGLTLFAKVDYSEMSTEELLAMIGYVSPQNQKVLEKELKLRFPNMNEKEKKIYLENLSKQKR